MRLRIYKATAARIPSGGIRRLFEMIAEEEADPDAPARVHLIITDNRRIRRLNRDFRSKDKATDVLSFNLDPVDEPGGVFGEIYISAPTAERQAAECGVTVGQEHLRLFCHGLLHLFGYDHQRKADSARMFARQEYYLKRLEETR